MTPNFDKLDGTPEQIAAFREQWEAAHAEQLARIEAGQTGDQPDDLTPEDEAILREIWSQP